jgi:selenoprotein W-related protein
LVCGGGGIFDVVVDGDMIFSKHEAGRFPESDEILTMIRSA